MPKKNSNKADFILALQELLQNKTVGTQEEIKSALQKKGFIVNQVKVSRALHKIGAIKMTEGDQVVYRLPAELVAITPNDSLKQLILIFPIMNPSLLFKPLPDALNLSLDF
jgi:arginine repressor